MSSDPGDAEAPPEDARARPDPGAHRAGIVALLGPPNAGKSTLLNALLGEKLAIVTAKPQTTRSRILGIHSIEGAQIGFVDTPGLHRGSKLLNRMLNEAVKEAARGCDLALLLVDLERGFGEEHAAVLELLREIGSKVGVLAVGTKLDRVIAVGGEAVRSRGLWPPPAEAGVLDSVETSARDGRGLDALLERIVAELPESPPLYPEDELTDRPLRWLAAELVREALFEELAQELPYTTAVEVIAFDESRPERIHIQANLLVARSSQKRMVIGSGGRVIKRIGIRARKGIEALTGTAVYLELWVKVDPRWLKDKGRIEELGYR